MPRHHKISVSDAVYRRMDAMRGNASFNAFLQDWLLDEQAAVCAEGVANACAELVLERAVNRANAELQAHGRPRAGSNQAAWKRLPHVLRRALLNVSMPHIEPPEQWADVLMRSYRMGGAMLNHEADAEEYPDWYSQGGSLRHRQARTSLERKFA